VLGYFIVVAFKLCCQKHPKISGRPEMEMSETHHLLVYADDVNTLSENINSIEIT
jgi:hypothetical protein